MNILERAWNKILRDYLPKYAYHQNTYSQCGEDVIVQFLFDALQIEKPSYLDVGAHHPFKINNTALLHSKGSRGINIEPDPDLFKAFPKHRTNDCNLNIGIADKAGSANFFRISASTLNTFSEEDALNYTKEGNFEIIETVSLKTDTIQNVIDKYANGKFPQFLTIDAEGVDELILKSIDFEKNYPIVICIETISFSTSGNGVKNANIISFLEQKGYLLYADTNINSIFIKQSIWQR